MGNVLANAIDWYINKLNTLHLIPVNAATMLRDMSSKQIGGNDFRPRPLTIDNFTDAELDAIHSLSYDAKGRKYGPITHESYEKIAPKGDIGELDPGTYVSPKQNLGFYLEPLRSVSTTLGRTSGHHDGDDYVITDLYDHARQKFKRMADGTLKNMENGGVATDKELDSYIAQMKDLLQAPYMRVRSKMFRLGHSESDPDEQKISTNISMKQIRDRLGNTIGRHAIRMPMDKKQFVLRSAGAGAITGAPVGAMLGAISGAMLMIDKKRRKKWLKTMLTHVLGGAAIAGAAGALGGGYAANNVYDRFQRKSAEAPSDGKQNEKRNRKRAEQLKSAIIAALAYSVPASALAGLGAYSYHKGSDFVRNMFSPNTKDDLMEIV